MLKGAMNLIANSKNARPTEYEHLVILHNAKSGYNNISPDARCEALTLMMERLDRCPRVEP